MPEDESERLSRWIREHGRAVQGFLLARIGPGQAEDLTQEVFARAWEARERYLERGKVRGYLLTIADRLARDARRRRTFRLVDPLTPGGHEPIDPQAGPDHSALRDEENGRVRRALESLSEPQQRTLLLRYFADMPFAEIAHQLGCPINTVLSHARRGLLTLRELLVEERT